MNNILQEEFEFNEKNACGNEHTSENPEKKVPQVEENIKSKIDTSKENENIIQFKTNTLYSDENIALTKKKRIKPIIASALISSLLFGLLVGVFIKNNTVTGNSEVMAAFSDIKSEEPIIVPSNGETLNFEKNAYTVEVRKTVDTNCTYTPPENEKDTEKKSPKITYTSSNIQIADVDKSGKIRGVSTGSTSIVAVSETGIYTTVPVTVTAPKEHKIKDVPLIYQSDKYPSGCESVSSTMLLNYYGFDITVDDFIDKYLEKAYFSYGDDGTMYGPDAYSSFIGSPYSEDALGCFAPVIENAMNKYLKSKNYRAVDLTGSSVESLINNYVANNKPVVIWATMWMQEPVVTYEWKVKGSKNYSPYKDGDTYQWLANEHCMVLIGYDKDYYYFNDPLETSVVAYDRDTFENRYEEMGKNALVIDKIT